MLKELITIAANQARGDPLTPTNVTGLCPLRWNLLYQMARARMRSAEAVQIKQLCSNCSSSSSSSRSA